MAKNDADDSAGAEAEAEAVDFGPTQGLIGGGTMVAAAGFVLAIAAHPRWMGPLLLVVGLAAAAAGVLRMIRYRRARAGVKRTG